MATYKKLIQLSPPVSTYYKDTGSKVLSIRFDGGNACCYTNGEVPGGAANSTQTEYEAASAAVTALNLNGEEPSGDIYPKS